MAVTGLNKPDFRTIAAFRMRHLVVLQALFGQGLTLCAKAGLEWAILCTVHNLLKLAAATRNEKAATA